FFEHYFEELVSALEIIIDQSAVDTCLFCDDLRGGMESAFDKENAHGGFFDQLFGMGIDNGHRLFLANSLNQGKVDLFIPEIYFDIFAKKYFGGTLMTI